MRFALIADIHGNLQPLEAVARDIRRRGADRVICLGDALTIGLQPGSVIDLLQELPCRFVMGNHDDALLNRGRAAELHIAEHLVPSLDWTLDNLTARQIDVIRSFEASLRLVGDNGTELLCYHGTPRSNYRGIFPATPVDEIEQQIAGATARVLIGGHTHQQMIRDVAGRLFMNPGSVGSVFKVPPESGDEVALQPWAEYAVLEIGGAGTRVEMIRLPFDLEAAREDIQRTSNPLKEWWLKQYR
jgi:putative phosphoesterase